MASKSFDVIVVGSGVGGLGTGAILAAKEGKKVLVLEKESFIGGRVLSFYGKDNQLWINNKRYSYKDLQKALASTGTFITHDQPDFEQVVKKGWFNYCINDGEKSMAELKDKLRERGLWPREPEDDAPLIVGEEEA